MIDLKNIIRRLAESETLDRKETEALFDFMISGEASCAQIGALLMALRMRGEAIQEIVGAVVAMRRRMIPVRAPAHAVDVVGTGGDGAGTYNISTCAAFICAGAGLPVAKHGNRALSSKSGAADVLSALGVNIDLKPEGVERCIAKANIGFMFAPAHHPALKNVMPVRVDLATRTIFNLLGPLLNPAGVKRHLVGVFPRQWIEPIAHAFKELGSERVLVVHGSDGLDEITTVGPTHVAELKDNQVRCFDITPEDVGLMRADPADLRGGTGAENAVALRDVLSGKPGPYRDVSLFNAAGAIIAGGVADDWSDALTLARDSIDSGKAIECLIQLVDVSNEAASVPSQPKQKTA